ncbi:unnamed protein product [Rotaria sp. Silwood2]|nr:unnamed protein product [Rotaria sp. Silwood2]
MNKPIDEHTTGVNDLHVNRDLRRRQYLRYRQRVYEKSLYSIPKNVFLNSTNINSTIDSIGDPNDDEEQNNIDVVPEDLYKKDDYYDNMNDESTLNSDIFPRLDVKDFESEHSDESDTDANDVSIENQSTNHEKFLYKMVDFIRQSNLNKTSTSLLLSLLRLTNTSTIRDIPTTTNSLWKQLDVSFTYETFFFCSSCFSPLIRFEDKCVVCNNNQRNNSELYIFSLLHELQRVVRSNIKLIEWYQQHEHQINADIVNSKAQITQRTILQLVSFQGCIYKQQQNLHGPSLTLMLSTDGKPIIKSKQTQSSVWPVMAFLVEIPPPIREYLNNTILLGLWHAPVSPPASLLLQKIVDNIKLIKATGVNIQIGNRIKHFSMDVQLISGDLPARSKCNQLTQHNGYFACSRCLMEGVRCSAPCENHTLYRWSDFSRSPPQRRTQKHIDECAKQAKLSKEPCFGVKGISPLFSLLSVPKQSTFDYFHLVLEIHLRVWYDIIKYDPNALTCINNYLNEIEYPHSFNRYPRDLGQYGKWKASQLRTFMVYVTMPVLVRLRLVMPRAFPEIYISHFSLLFIYIRVLRHFDDRDEVLQVPVFIDAYLRLFSSLYDKCKEIYSVHALCHLWQQVLDHGGLAYHSLFASESCLQHFAKLAHGSIALGEQISFWWSVFSQIQSKQVQYGPTLFTNEYLIDDTFFDFNMMQNYQQEFYLMARYNSSVTPGRARKLPAGASNIKAPFIDDMDECSADENEIDNNYPIIRDVSFYSQQQCESSVRRPYHNKNTGAYYTPQVKRKRLQEEVDDVPQGSLMESFKIIQNMFKDLNRKVDILTERGSTFEKKLDNVDKQLQASSRRIHKNPTTSEPSANLPVVNYIGRNILSGIIIETPAGLMKTLINQLFTNEEIINRQHEQINERTMKIKQAFWSNQGKIVRGNQRRGRSFRENKSVLTSIKTNPTTNNENAKPTTNNEDEEQQALPTVNNK